MGTPQNIHKLKPSMDFVFTQNPQYLIEHDKINTRNVCIIIL